MFNLPKDHFAVLPVTFDDGTTIYLRQLTGPQRSLWGVLATGVIGDSPTIDATTFRASIIACSIILLDRLDPDTNPDFIYGKNDPDEDGSRTLNTWNCNEFHDHCTYEHDLILSTPAPIQNAGNFFSRYLIDAHGTDLPESSETPQEEWSTEFQAGVDLVKTIRTDWSGDRVIEVGNEIERINNLSVSKLPDEPHETLTEREVRSAAKKSEITQTSETG